MYEDTTASLTLDETKDKTFVPISNSISTGYSNSYYWYKFKLQNQTEKSLKYIFESTEHLTHEMDFTIISKGEKRVTYEKGIGRYNKEGVVETTKLNFPIYLKKGEQKEIYIRHFSLYPNYTSFHIRDESSFNEYTLKHDRFLSLYFGAVLALILYNLFIFFYSRDSTYLLYVLYVTSFITWQMSMNGFPPFDTSSSIFRAYMLGSSVPFFIAFLLLFSRRILETEKLFPKIDQAIRYVAYLYFILAICSWFDSHTTFVIINALGTFLLPFLLYIGFKSYLCGNKIALFYLIAQTTFLATTTMLSLMADGYLEYNIVTRHGIVVGSFLEILLFSLALAYRLRLLEDEKIGLMCQSKEELTKLIDERTKALTEANKELEHLSVTDRLTSIANRLGLDNVFEYELHKFERYESNHFGVILIDIDYFKKINDMNGHQVGDNVLQEFAKILKENLRNSDTVGRWGGEEFLIICPNTQREGVLTIAETLREKIEAHNFKEVGNLTASFGVSMMQMGDTKLSFFKRVDDALYEAKQTGRNKVVFLK